LKTIEIQKASKKPRGFNSKYKKRVGHYEMQKLETGKKGGE